VPGDKKRLFLAVNLAIATTRRIAEAVGRMRQAAERRGLRVGWVAPANLHVTLKFLGWTGADAVEAIGDRMARRLAGVAPFEVAARGAGAFPDEAHARILWVGVDDPGGGLARLAAIADEHMAALGYPRETRPFSAHVTVGRVKEGRGADEVLAPFAKADFGSSSIGEVILYESQMRSTGSEYTALKRIGFEGPERQTRGVEGSNESEGPTNGGQP
jgi:2'-5' RNA ligase